MSHFSRFEIFQFKDLWCEITEIMIDTRIAIVYVFFIPIVRTLNTKYGRQQPTEANYNCVFILTYNLLPLDFLILLK